MEQASSTSVCINGSILSSLLFKLRNSPGHAEGFLVGEVCKRSVDAITDSQSAGIREETKIHVLSFTVLHERFSFYNHYGRPDIQRVQSVLGDQYKFIVGWYSYRCNTSHRVSLREKSVHHKLLAELTHITSKEFLFGLVTESLVEQTPIHSTEYSFYTWDGSCFQTVDVEVTNLRASGAVPYQTMSVSPSLLPQSKYAAVVQGQSSSFLNSDGQVIQAVAVETLYRSMLDRLQPLVSQLVQSNDEVISLNEEVTRLQEFAEELQREAAKGEIEDNKSEDEHCELGHQDSDNLIDLSTPDHIESKLSAPSYQLENEQTAFGTHDLLSESILDPSEDLHTDLLQPSVLDANQPTYKDNTVSGDTSSIQQSQELF